MPPELDPYEPDFHLTPEDEAALMEELENGRSAPGIKRSRPRRPSKHEPVWKSTSELGSRRWAETSTPSSRRGHGDNVASMAWGARKISTQALTAEAAGLAFEAEELRDAFEGPTVPCPCCEGGRLGRRGADLAIACDKCDLALPDQRDGLSLDDVSASLAATFRAHTQAGCPRSPAFASTTGRATRSFVLPATRAGTSTSCAE